MSGFGHFLKLCSIASIGSVAASLPARAEPTFATDLGLSFVATQYDIHLPGCDTVNVQRRLLGALRPADVERNTSLSAHAAATTAVEADGRLSLVEDEIGARLEIRDGQHRWVAGAGNNFQSEFVVACMGSVQVRLKRDLAIRERTEIPGDVRTRTANVGYSYGPATDQISILYDRVIRDGNVGDETQNLSLRYDRVIDKTLSFFAIIGPTVRTGTFEAYESERAGAGFVFNITSRWKLGLSEDAEFRDTKEQRYTTTAEVDYLLDRELTARGRVTNNRLVHSRANSRRETELGLVYRPNRIVWESAIKETLIDQPIHSRGYWLSSRLTRLLSRYQNAFAMAGHGTEDPIVVKVMTLAGVGHSVLFGSPSRGVADSSESPRATFTSSYTATRVTDYSDAHYLAQQVVLTFLATF